jgi:hypothetical protein
MKRWGRVVILYLVLGAVVNVGVAWGASLWIHPSRASLADAWDVTPGNPYWLFAFSRFGTCDRIVRYAIFDDPSESPRKFLSQSWPSWSAVRISSTTKEVLRDVAHYEYAFGWPRRAMIYEVTVGPTLPFISASTVSFQSGLPHRGLGQVGKPIEPQLAFPLRPIWPGFLANTALYAAALCLLSLVPTTMKRAIRRHHGRCIACGYDLRGAAHEYCPECGGAIAEAARA